MTRDGKFYIVKMSIVFTLAFKMDLMHYYIWI